MRKSHYNKSIIVSYFDPLRPIIVPAFGAVLHKTCGWPWRSGTDEIGSQILPHLRACGLDARSIHSTIPTADWRIRLLCLMVSSTCVSTPEDFIGINVS